MKNVEILEGIEAIDKALWLCKEKILIISDLHTGYEESLNKRGVFAPRIQFVETKKDLEELFEKLIGKKISTIVINGDLKHEFQTISIQEWNETIKILDFFQIKCKKIILIRGNHDTILGPIASRRGLKIVDYFVIKRNETSPIKNQTKMGNAKLAKAKNGFFASINSNSIVVLHGDRILENKEVLGANILIIGHEHPAISLREGMKIETYKCFLLGKWKSKLKNAKEQKLIVMPSFIPITEGTDILKEDVLSPYLKQNLWDFEIFAVGEKIYRFGKLKDLK